MLSIIIINYNVREQILDCLNSIYENPPSFEFEVFVVDNNSIDRSIEAIKEKFPEVKIIENQENLGFPKACNQGIEISSGKYILLLNPDTIILNNALAKMVDFLESNPCCGIMGAKLVNESGLLQRSCFTTLSLKSIFFEATYLGKIFPNNKFFGSHHYGGWGYDSIKKVDAVSGACMLIRRELFDKIGLLDETLFCGEDNDLCLRANKNKFDVVFYPFAEIVHIGHQSLNKNVYVKLVNEYLTKVKFFKKHHNSMLLILLKVLIFLEVCLKIVFRKIGLAMNFPPDAEIRLKAYYKVLSEICKK